MYTQETSELTFQLLCLTWKAKYEDFLELVSILNTVLKECVEYKDMTKNTEIAITFTKQQYFCNAFYVFKTFYLSKFPFFVDPDVERIGNDFCRMYINFKA